MKYAIIICLFLCSGCVLPGKTTKEGSETVKAGYRTQADIVEAPSIVTGDGNTITVHGDLPATRKTVDAESKTDMESAYSVVTQMSLGANILLLGIGLLLLKIVFKGSRAAQATMGLIDSGIASAVAMAQNSTDHKEIANAHHLRSELEALKRHLPG